MTYAVFTRAFLPPRIEQFRERTRLAILILVGIVGLGLPSNAAADSIVVTYSAGLVTTADGEIQLDFAVTNNLPNGGKLYLFGVAAPFASMAGAPQGWSNAYPSSPGITLSGYGGSATFYNIIWGTLGTGSAVIHPGQTPGGFLALQSEMFVVPETLRFFAFAVGGDRYTGTDAFINNQLGNNPGFEGIARRTDVAPTPEPATLTLLGLGLMGAVLRRKRATLV